MKISKDIGKIPQQLCIVEVHNTCGLISQDSMQLKLSVASTFFQKRFKVKKRE